MAPLDPLLAAGIGELLPLIVIVIGFISWVINNAGGQNKPVGPPVRRPPRPRNQPPAEEIDVFLEDVQRPARPVGPPPQSAPARPAAKPQRPQSGAKPASRPRPSQPSRPARPGEEIAQRHVKSRNLGSGVREHVAEHVPQNAVGGKVERDLSHRVDRQVNQYLGQSTPAAPPPVAATPLSTQVRELLGRPESMQQAILLNEILTRPSQRPRRRLGPQ